ncbi:phosphotransferase [Streptomyces sp. NPDC058001]|uniref:phosphotransferase n=1 Tax=Streptomyces sp. NPDC058001 TaxID=3346300 RepID=UPI0036EADE66
MGTGELGTGELGTGGSGTGESGTGDLIGTGRSADVFALGEDWVLRRYRNGGDASAEAQVMAYLAGRGYPVPGLRDPAPAGPGAFVAPRTDLVMRRLRGPSMLGALAEGTLTAEEAGATLADLLHRLHALPARVSADPAHRVLHLDLHPDNVMLTPEGPVVIDWGNTEEGDPCFDRSMSALILAQVAVAPGPYAVPARSVLVSLTAHLGPLDDDCLARARARRATDPCLTASETSLLDEAVRLVRDSGN